MIEGLDRTDNNNFIHQTQRLDWYISKEISANYTIANDDKYKFISCKNTGIMATLPLTTSNADRVIEIMKTTAKAGSIAVGVQGSDKFMNLTTTTLSTNYHGWRFKSLPGYWILTDNLP